MKNNKLKDGKVLEELIDRFNEESTIENMHSLLLCLIDTELQIPMFPIISEEDQKQIDKSNPGDQVELKNEMRVEPALLIDEKESKKYFPVFSSLDNVDKDYIDNFSWINMDINVIIKFIEDNDDVDGIILNPIRDKTIVIEDRIYELLKHILSNINKN